MAIELVVTEPFGVPGDKTYMHGDVITDEAKIKTVLAGWSSHVVKRQAEKQAADEAPADLIAPATVVTFDTTTDTEKAKPRKG